MKKIRSLDVSAFRGARDNLSISFGGSPKSLAIYGDNGAGKSTVTDAIEWLLTDKVGHLWAEECKKEALRNVFASDSVSGAVQISLSEGVECEKTISTDLKVSTANASENWASFLASASGERTVLRHGDIARLVIDTKSKKRDEIEKIVGYQDIKKFRDTLRRALSHLEKDSQYRAARAAIEQADASLLETCATTVRSDEDLIAALKLVLAPFELKMEVVDGPTFGKARDELKARLGDTKRAEKKLRLEAFVSELVDLGLEIDNSSSAFDRFHSEYFTLLNEPETKSLVRLSGVLKSGLNYLQQPGQSEDSCPLCEQEVDHQHLERSVLERMETLRSIQARLETIYSNKDYALELLRTVQSRIDRISKDYGTFEELVPLSGSFQRFSQGLPDDILAINQAVLNLDALGDRIQAMPILTATKGVRENTIETVRAKAKTLALDEAERSVFDALETCSTITTEYGKRKSNKAIADKFVQQVANLEKVSELFREHQREATQKVIDAITSDVSKFFGLLHPTSGIDRVKLKIVGDDGVEFEYSFHGKIVSPPRKYLSESYLNSLGIALFLASAKLFNEHCQFVILDDIVTSFDNNLRRRVLRLLNSEFADWQIVLLTHERYWFELMQREFPASNWFYKEVRYDPELGSTLESARDTSIKAIRQSTAGQDITNGVRRYLEAVLKQICVNLEVKVAFRFNDVNEKRMSEELLSALKSTCNKRKCTEITDSGVIDRLRASALIANTGSHDNVDQIYAGDTDVILEDIEQLESLTFCSKCKSDVSAKRSIQSQKRIECNCGKTSLSWKA